MSFINKKRLIDLFCELVKIKSPSGQEEEIAKVVIDKLEALGLQVSRDSYGNIIARLRGPGKPLILCGHLDTVAIGEGSEIRLIVEEDTIRSDGSTILGADNKDAISAIIEMLTVLSERNLKHRSLEIVFTREEEAISRGAQNLDLSLLSGKECIISDYSGIYGTIITSAPYYFRFEVRIIGKRSHVKEPEQGVNAIRIAAEAISKMPLGRIDDLTTSNIGYQVSGLKGIIDEDSRTIGSLSRENRNTVPDLAIVFGEVRGPKIDQVTKALHNIERDFSDAARVAGGKVEFNAEKLADGYYFEQNDSLVSMVSKIFKAQGITPKLTHSIGGSDANIFNACGIHTMVISSAHKDAHTYTECLFVEDFVRLADFYVRLVTI